MKKALIVAALAVSLGVVTEAFYVPRFGPAALDAAYNDYLNCVRSPPIIEFARRRRVNDFRLSGADCLGIYLDRREAIRWRYYCFRTLAGHVLGHPGDSMVVMKRAGQ